MRSDGLTISVLCPHGTNGPRLCTFTVLIWLQRERRQQSLRSGSPTWVGLSVRMSFKLAPGRILAAADAQNGACS